MRKNNIPMKVALGYAAVVVILVMSIWLVYTNTLSILSINQASRDYIQKREKADSTMTALLKEEQNNLQQLSNVLNEKESKSYLTEKMNNLNNGKDSVVVHQKVAKTHEAKNTTVEITKSKKGFFRRLADAFKKEHAETLSIQKDSNHAITDTITPVNVAENVADILEQINKKEKSASKNKDKAVSREMAELKMANAELALRSAQQLNDLHQRERTSMQQSINQAMEARQHLLWQIELLAVIAIVAVLILFTYIWQDNKKERIYRENLEDANEEIQEANEEIQRVMKQRERLLLTITHDIKAPAASISGFIDLMQEDVKGRRGQECLQNIKHSATHLSQLVASLLDYHQLENGQIELHATPFCPATLVQQNVEEFRLLAEQKGLHISCDTDECCTQEANSTNDISSANIYQADAFRIRQILNNLISNAIKYTDKGNILVTASITNHQQLTLSVKDTGKGMTAEETEKIFQAFTRLKSAQGIEGTGLGLSITHELVTLLGGSIHVDSKEGEGSTFTVSLPIEKGERTETHLKENLHEEKNKDKDKAQEEEDRKEKKKRYAFKNQKILILDDDKLQLQLLQEMLRRLAGDCWQVFACNHVSEALTILHQEQPALMLLDIEMPEMTGMELIKHINHNQMMVVAMTAHDSSILPELQQAGFDDCLFKPFNKEKFQEILGIEEKEEEQDKEKEQIERGKEIIEKKDEDASNYVNNNDNNDEYGVFAPLLVFADDDPEAKKEIVQTVKQEMHNYLSSLQSSIQEEVHITDIGKAAHKLLPIATMLQLKSTETLKALAPEHIQCLEETEIREYVQAVIKELHYLYS